MQKHKFKMKAVDSFPHGWTVDEFVCVDCGYRSNNLTLEILDHRIDMLYEQLEQEKLKKEKDAMIGMWDEH